MYCYLSIFLIAMVDICGLDMPGGRTRRGSLPGAPHGCATGAVALGRTTCIARDDLRFKKNLEIQNM